MKSDHATKPRPGGGDERPDPLRPRLWVETWAPESMRPEELTVLNDWLIGFHIHYIPGDSPTEARTKPCLQEQGHCEWCGAVNNLSWKGYLGVHHARARRPSILEVTVGAWETTPDLRSRDGKLRGTRWKAFREKNSTRSRMLMQRLLKVDAEPRFGRVDVLSVLERMFAVPRAVLARECGVEEGLYGWGHPQCTLTDEEIKQAGAILPAATEKDMAPTAQPADWRTFTQRLKCKQDQGESK